MGDGDGAPNGVGAAVLPKGDVDDNPPVEPNGLLLVVLEAVLPKGDGAGAAELPKGDADDDPPFEPNGLLLLPLEAVLPNGDGAGAAELPKGDGLGAGAPKGEDDTGGFCCVEGPEDDPNGLAPVLPNPEDGATVDCGGASLPNPEDENPAGEAVAVDWLDDSCKGFGTLYLVASF
mmetsp:Transcript_17001/g.42449  ORF Transcript_17001/g.42449 Transcript_17001/m.42449 type:complete len:176 (+) Transcript_17001:990-1517(+)